MSNAEMNISSALFRYRIYILAAVFGLGFWAPWNHWFGWEPARVWLVIPGEISRLGWMPLGQATLTLTIVAVVCAVLAAVWRTWGTAYLHASVVYDSRMRADQVVADGPFRFVRNPIYIGTMFHALALALLMSPSGAIFVIVLLQVLRVILVTGEERLMLARHGEAYAKYLQAVPRWVPAITPKVPASGARPQWAQAVLGEIYVCAVAILFAGWAWRYNAQLLERGILIAYGTRIVLRALAPTRKPAEMK